MLMTVASFEPHARRMEEKGLHPLQVEAFRRHFLRLQEGETGTLGRDVIRPVVDLPHLDELPDGGEDLRDRVALLNLNGGLGTTMGLTGPKSLLELRDGLTFLDVLARQVLHHRQAAGGNLPLVLMNSFNTSAETRRALDRYPQLKNQQVPLELLQSQVPKVRVDDLKPVRWPQDPILEWCPPGHGDIYLSLVCSGMLERLTDQGFRYLFVSNVDNLGAGLDLRIPAWMRAGRVPFLMEVADRTEADRKGGHLACRRDGRLVLREVAMCPPEERDDFQDVRRYRYFNTNNLWVDLLALKGLLQWCGGVLDLPLIVNRKTVDPGDPRSPAVYQLETAMGAAISVFDGARALRVPRARFAPVKTLEDLLAVRSDAYLLTPSFHIRLHPDRSSPPQIHLDPDFFRRVGDLQVRMPQGPPSLLSCTSLKISGDVVFGRAVRCLGEVEVLAPVPARIPDGAILQGRVRLG